MNLLDNWDFRGANPNPLLNAVVNQRGQNIYTGGYGIDRWQRGGTGGNLQVRIETGFLRYIGMGIGGHTLRQFLEFPHLYAGKTLTFSIIYRTNEQCTSTFTFRCGINGSNVFNETANYSDCWTMFTKTFTVLSGEAIGSMDVVIGASINQINDFIDVQAIKLELGSVSTLANDPPMDFGTELAVCKRYYQKSYDYRIAPGTLTTINAHVGKGFSSTDIIMAHNYETEMRITPTLTVYDTAGTSDRVSLKNTLTPTPGIGSGFSAQAHSSKGTLRLRSSQTVIQQGVLYAYHWEADANL